MTDQTGIAGRLKVAVITAMALAMATTGAALAASGGTQTGTWGGTIANRELSFAEGSYTTKIVVKALRGRVSWVVATVRMECPGTSVWDAQVSKRFPAGKGPKLTADGGFVVSIETVDGPFSKAGATVRVSGAVRPAGGSGTASARAEREGCSGSGTWRAKRIN
jgi:hypothetical protein